MPRLQALLLALLLACSAASARCACPWPSGRLPVWGAPCSPGLALPAPALPRFKRLASLPPTLHPRRPIQCAGS